MKKHTATIIRGSSIMFTGKVLQTILLILINLAIGQILGARILGTVSLGLAILQISWIISVFGFYRTINRFGPEYRAKGLKKKILELAGTTSKFSLILSLLITAGLLFFAESIGSIFSDANLAATLRILALGLTFFTQTRIFVAFATSYESTKVEALIENIIITALILVGLFVFYSLGFGYLSAPYAYLCGYIGGFATAVILKKFTNLKEIEFTKTIPLFDTKYITYSVPIVISITIYFLFKQLDTLALGFFRSSTEVGIYSAALKITAVPTIILASMNTIFYPLISRLINSERRESATQAYRDTLKVLTYLTVPITIFIVIFGNNIISFFGKEFEISWIPILILSLGTFLNTFSGPVDFVLNALDKQHYVMYNSFIALTTNIILNVLLTPTYGILGAAIASTVSITIQNYLGIAQLYFTQRIVPYSRQLLFSLLLILPVGIALLLIKTYIFTEITGQPIVELIVLGATAVTSYILFILFISIFRLYEEKDIVLLKSLYSKIFSLSEKESS